MVETSVFENAFVEDFDAVSRGFFYLSPWRSLWTQGCFSRLTTPVAGAEQPDGAFQCQLRQQFSEAKQQGIQNPIMVGAIPFDASQPSALFIPEASHFFDRQQLAGGFADTPLPTVTSRTALPDHAAFTDMVAQAVNATSQGELDKVVLSRLMDITTERPVDTAMLMRRIINQNPTSYSFHVPLPDGGSLLGASPELLLRKQNGEFSSCPLAGSARRQQDRQQDNAVGQRLMHSSKDRYEHKLVTDAMRDVLQSRSSLLSVPETPQLVTTPTLWHLATWINGEARDPRDNALSLASLLHPTPALSGFPHARAQKLIAQLEPFDRQLFGGIVGWCNEAGDGEWVVTIRCGTVHNTRVRLFAGAGIVPDSSPESEWNETGVKLDTMLRAFGLQ